MSSALEIGAWVFAWLDGILMENTSFVAGSDFEEPEYREVSGELIVVAPGFGLAAGLSGVVLGVSVCSKTLVRSGI